MSILTPIPPAMPFWKRAFFAIPVIGWLARDVMYGARDNIYYLLVIVATLIVLSVATWGLPALVVKAVFFVPLYFIFLVVVGAPWTPNE
mgnify:CR=1 FL=1